MTKTTKKARRNAPPQQEKLAEKQREVFKSSTPEDVTSTRAKSQRHGKVTADKWNQ